MGRRVFKYFISFAGNDDYVPPEHQKGWVTHFSEWLQHNFIRESGCHHTEVEPFFYKRTTDTSPFPDYLEKRAREADVLVALMSRSFHERAWCKMEIEHFLKGRRAAGDTDRTERLLVVTLGQDAHRHDAMHPALRDRRLFPFWHKDRFDNCVLLCEPVPTEKHPEGPEFVKRVVVLARAMAQLAEKDWKSPAPKEKKPGALQALLTRPIDKTVFVDGLLEDRDRIDATQRAVVGQGFRSVVPPTSAGEARASTPAGDFSLLLRESDIYLLVRRDARATNVLDRLGLAAKEALRLGGKRVYFANLRAGEDPIPLDARFSAVDLSRAGQDEKKVAKRLKAETANGLDDHQEPPP